MKDVDICNFCGRDTLWHPDAQVFVCGANHKSGTARHLEFTKEVQDCTHENFWANVFIARILDAGAYMAEVRVRCLQCGEPFRFKGLPSGLHYEQPMTSVDGLELRAPVEPQGMVKLAATSSFTVPDIPKRH